MSIFQTYRQALKESLGYTRVGLYLWIATLVASGVGALPFRALLLAESGHSLRVRDVVKGFDYTFLNDFLQNYGVSLTPIMNQSMIMVALHVFIVVFLMGGLLQLLIRSEGYHVNIFWQGCGHYFWRLFRLTIAFLVLQFFVLAVFVVLYLLVTKMWSPEPLKDESIITSCLRWLIPLYLVVAAYLLNWQDYAKITLVQHSKGRVWLAIARSFKYATYAWRTTYPLFILSMLILGSVLAIYYLLASSYSVDSFATIIASFVITQLLVVVRYWVRIVRLVVAKIVVGDKM